MLILPRIAGLLEPISGDLGREGAVSLDSFQFIVGMNAFTVQINTCAFMGNLHESFSGCLFIVLFFRESLPIRW